MSEFSREIESKAMSHEALPKAALRAISKRQRSYIDEFTFFDIGEGKFDAWYGGSLLARWNGRAWINPS